MIDSLIENKMKYLKNTFLIIFLLSAVYVLVFSTDIFQDRLIAVGLSLLAGFLTIGMVYFVLWVQVKNPFCSTKVLNFFCNFLVYFALVLLFMGFVSLILYREAFTVVGVSSVEGFLIGSVLIKRKYIITEKDKMITN